MNQLSKKVDQDQRRRVRNGEFLFMTAPNLVNKEKIHGLSMGNEIKSLKWIFAEMPDTEIFKIFRNYIKTKNLNVEVLKEQHQYWKVVDKVYTEENNLFMIFCIENKFPAINVYCTKNLDELKKDLIKFIENYKSK